MLTITYKLVSGHLQKFEKRSHHHLRISSKNSPASWKLELFGHFMCISWTTRHKVFEWDWASKRIQNAEHGKLKGPKISPNLFIILNDRYVKFSRGKLQILHLAEFSSSRSHYHDDSEIKSFDNFIASLKNLVELKIETCDRVVQSFFVNPLIVPGQLKIFSFIYLEPDQNVMHLGSKLHNN